LGIFLNKSAGKRHWQTPEIHRKTPIENRVFFTGQAGHGSHRSRSRVLGFSGLTGYGFKPLGSVEAPPSPDFSPGHRSWRIGSSRVSGHLAMGCTGLSSRVAGLRGSAPGFHRKSPSNRRISALVRRNRHWTAVRRLCALHDGSRVSAPGSLSISQSLFPSQSP
jgi:hypothetical protein